jgi:hypothetical protein
MKVLCIVMTIVFFVVATLATIGCICEWAGKCSTCDHGEACTVTIRARLYSCFMTVILWICGATWIWLTWEAYREDRGENFERQFKQIQTDYLKNMENGYVNKRG